MGTTNPNYKPSEGKREEFRKYLEKTGVTDALTKVLVALYEEPEKPENAIEYICNKLANQICGETLDALKAHLEEAKAKIGELEEENNALKGATEGSSTAEGEHKAEGEEHPPAEEAAAPTE